MKVPMIGALVAAAAIALAPAAGAAQQTSPWWSWALPRVEGGSQVRTASGLRTVPRERSENDDAWSRARRGQDPRTTRDQRDGTYDRRGSEIPRSGRQREGSGKGPKFCRNGQGHPVYGMAWCREKGFGGYYASGPVWTRASIGDVILRRPRSGYGTLSRGGLIDVLGSTVLGRLLGGSGTSGDLYGRLFQPEGSRATVLQLQSGGVPVAELTDLDADGRADVVLLRQR